MKEALKNTPSTPFRVPNSVKFVKIDRTSGKYPTPLTPKERVFFEAFKVDDTISSAESSDDASEEMEEDDGFGNKTSDSDPTGIY
jgi:membrane carboxypeptidase/penicillin-binding protein